MSQTAAARPYQRTAPRRATPAPRRLRVVAPPAAQGSGVFAALCVALLLGGFVGVLVLNTAMAKGSYTMRDLQLRSDELADTRDDLRHSLDAVSGPGPLAREARSLGMVPAETAAFLRLSDGKVVGVATKASANDRFSVVTETSPTSRRPASASTTRPAADGTAEPKAPSGPAAPRTDPPAPPSR